MLAAVFRISRAMPTPDKQQMKACSCRPRWRPCPMFSVLGKVHSQSLVTVTPRLSPRLPRTEAGLCAGRLQLSEVWSSVGTLYGPACLQCPLKCFAADVHDWAMQSLSKAAGERHTNARQP